MRLAQAVIILLYRGSKQLLEECIKVLWYTRIDKQKIKYPNPLVIKVSFSLKSTAIMVETFR